MSSHLQTIREARRLSRADVATRLGMSPKQLERWEKGKTDVKRMHLLALADIYDVPVEELEEEVAA
ncbi:MAG: helix-turn-helix transcriptional regulator [Actinobacteria bacterium]|nr:helix-turn-helix transcriptional regulator [Actinomycetota bacterium]